jgi:hypothetical protein
VEKKDDEVGLDSRLLKKDNSRFMPLGVGEGKAMRLRPRFKAQHYPGAGAGAHSISNSIFIYPQFCPLQCMPRTFTPTPEQLALREARRLKKEKATTNATSTPPSSLVNNEKGEILPRPWLAVQDSHTNATLTAKIMTWNVRNFVFCPC